MLTAEVLKACMPDCGDRAAIYVEALNHAMTEFECDTLGRQASFLAQVAHESGSLKYTLELADGRNYDPTVNPVLAANLGNTEPGDGPRFKGRGLLQITGRANYEACSLALKRNLVEDMAYLETPMGASRSAAWFFKARGCLAHADLGNFWSVSKIINGGTNGLDDRIRHYVRIRKVFGI